MKYETKYKALEKLKGLTFDQLLNAWESHGTPEHAGNIYCARDENESTFYSLLCRQNDSL